MYHHTIELITPAADANCPTCVAYALGLTFKSIQWDASGRRNCLVGWVNEWTEFLEWYLPKLAARKNEPEEGDLIVYCLTGNPVPPHVGIAMSAARVRSKWGKGSVWAHDHWEVPEGFGDFIVAYKMPPREMSEVELACWVNLRGGGALPQGQKRLSDGTLLLS